MDNMYASTGPIGPSAAAALGADMARKRRLFELPNMVKLIEDEINRIEKKLGE
jgi:hypothetical protein